MYYITLFKYHSVPLNDEAVGIEIYRSKEDREKDLDRISEIKRFKEVETRDLKPWELEMLVKDKDPYEISFH